MVSMGLSISPNRLPLAGLKKPSRRILKSLSSKAAASEDRRRYPPHFVELFPRTVDLGEPKSPYIDSDLRESLRYVEDLNDARTTLAGFFSILLKISTALDRLQ